MKLSKSDIEKIDKEIQRILFCCPEFQDQSNKNNFIDVCRIWLSIPVLIKEYDFFYDGIKLCKKVKISNMVCPDKFFPTQPTLRFNTYDSSNTIVHYPCTPSFLDLGDKYLLTFTNYNKDLFLSKFKILKKDAYPCNILDNFPKY